MDVKQRVRGLKSCLLCFFLLLKHDYWACREKGSVGPEPQERVNKGIMVSENLGLEEEEMVTVKVPL